MAEAEIQKIQTGIPFPINGMQALDDVPSGIGHLMVHWVANNASDVPPYWSRARDIWLREFVIRNGALKTAVTTFVNKAVTVPVSITPKDRSISRHVNTAKEIEMGLMRYSGSMSSTALKGFKEAFKMFAFDYLTQDSGAFMLVMGEGPADGPIVGKPSGVLHLDASQCTRTKNAEFPVIYDHIDGKRYMLHYTRVIEMSNLPSPNVYLNGTGLSPVSCCIEAAQELWDIYQYNAEMFGSHPPRQIIYSKIGATLKELEASVEAWNIKLRQQNRTHFGGTLFIAPKSPQQQFDLGIQSLANQPEGFNRRDVTTINKSEIAAAFGLDLRDLAYTLGAPSRTGDAEVQDRKGRGKGVGEFIETFVRKFEERYVNTELYEIRFDYLDDEQDEQDSLIRDKRSAARERDLRSGITTVRVEREIMWERGELSLEQFEDMELLDGRLPNGLDVMLLFQSQDRQFTEWLDIGIPDPTDISANDPIATADAIHQKILEVSQQVHSEANPKQARKARQALAALEKLRSMYQMPEASDVGDPALVEAMDEGKDELGQGTPAEQPETDETNTPDVEKALGDTGLDDIDEIISLYGDNFESLAQRALDGEIERDTFQDALAALVASFILALFQRGARRQFFEMEEEAQQAVQRVVEENTTAISGLTDDLYSGRYDLLSQVQWRIDEWMNSAIGAFYEGMVHDPANPHLIWVLGPTSDHCSTCVRLNGQIHTAQEWQASSFWPRNRNLACKGYHCLCQMFPANGPSLGNF